MRSQNRLLVACIAMVWSAAAAAQGTPQGGAQTARGGQNQSAAPATSAGTTTPGTQTPVRQPNTSPPPSAPTPAPANTSPPPSTPTPAPANTSPPPSPSNSMPQQTVVPNQPNSASNARDTSSANRARVATQTDTVPPASRGVGTTASRPDCSQMRGIEKSECERRDTSRDDLPAGVTTTQQPQPPR
jgi:outer membrane biosynthesis protein TonB